MLKNYLPIILFFVLISLPTAAEETIIISPAAPAQGEPFLVRISSEAPLAWAEGEVFGLDITLEPYGSDLIGLAGAPRNQKPGDYPLEFTVQFADGSSASLSRTITIEPTEWAVSSLKVDPKFVELSAKALEQIRADNAAAGKAYANTADTRLWHKPFIRPGEGRWSSPFGVSRVFNGEERSYHSGADIAMPTGTEVIASNDGRVVLVRHMFFGGKTVIIDHGYGVFTGYMHLSEFKVEQGDLVEQGQLIGLSGATGRVTGPHLHWMLRIQNQKLNAASLLDLTLE